MQLLQSSLVPMPSHQFLIAYCKNLTVRRPGNEASYNHYSVYKYIIGLFDLLILRLTRGKSLVSSQQSSLSNREWYVNIFRKNVLLDHTMKG